MNSGGQIGIRISKMATAGRGMKIVMYSRKQNYITEYGNYRLRMNLPWFNGSMYIEEFLDWLSEVGRFFKYMDIKESQKMKLVVL